MNRFKTISKIFIVFLLSIAIVSSRISLADSGFDYGYDSGSSGGSSSSGGFSSSGGSSDGYSGGSYSSNLSPEETAAMIKFEITLFILCIIGAIFIHILNKSIDNFIRRLRKSPQDLEKIEQEKELMDKVIKINDTFDKVKEIDNTLNHIVVKDLIRDSFIDLQKLYSKKDLNGLRNITSDNLYNFYELRFKSFDTKKEHQIIDVDKVLDITINKATIINETLNVEVLLKSRENSYYVNDTKYIVSGSEEYKIYSYILGVDINIKTRKVVFNTKLTSFNDSVDPSVYREELLKINSDYTEEYIVNNAYKVYEALQYAWSNFDYEGMRKLISDELYNNYVVQLDTLKLKNQRNVMEDISLLGGQIVDYSLSDNTLSVTIKLRVSQKDYIVNAKNKIVRGNDKVHICTYKLYLEKGMKKQLRNCPNCGAQVSNAASKTCPNCGADLIDVSNDFIIVKKQIVNQ